MDHGGKKARFSDSVQIKQEAWGQDPNGARAMVVTDAAAAAAMPKVVIEIDKTLLDCPLCFSPLKPPVFQCRAQHAACRSCAASQSNNCHLCIDGGGVYEHIHWLDPYVLALKVPCPYEAYGCRMRVAYCLVADHQLECPHAPCHCPEPHCDFLGSPPALRGHLVLRHDWLVTPITLGKALALEMQATS